MSEFNSMESSRSPLEGCSLPLNGLPTSASQVDDSPVGNDDLLYRAIVCGGSNAALLRTAACVVSSKERSLATLPDKPAEIPAVQCRPTVSIRYLETDRPISITNVTLTKTDEEVLDIVNDFLTANGLSCDKRHPHSNIYRCHSVVDCAVLRFDIRLLPAPLQNGITVEFKRTMGPAECFCKVFKLFKKNTGCESSCMSPLQSPRYPCSEFDDNVEVDKYEIEKAVSAMAQWIESDSLEALQCVGQFFIAHNEYVIHSEKIINSICAVIAKLQNYSDQLSVLTTAIAISCIRKFISVSELLQSCNVISSEQVSVIVPAVARAAMNNDPTARREAVGLLLDLNPRFSADIRHSISQVQGLSLDSLISRHDAPNPVAVA